MTGRLLNLTTLEREATEAAAHVKAPRRAWFYCGLCGRWNRRTVKHCRCGSRYFVQSKPLGPNHIWRGIIPPCEENVEAERLEVAAGIRGWCGLTAKRRQRPRRIA